MSCDQDLNSIGVRRQFQFLLGPSQSPSPGYRAPKFSWSDELYPGQGVHTPGDGPGSFCSTWHQRGTKVVCQARKVPRGHCCHRCLWRVKTRGSILESVQGSSCVYVCGW